MFQLSNALMTNGTFKQFLYLYVIIEFIIHAIGIASFAFVAWYFVRRIEKSECKIRKAEENILKSKTVIATVAKEIIRICTIDKNIF